MDTSDLMALIKHDLIRHWALQQIRIEYQLGNKQRLDDIPSFKHQTYDDTICIDFEAPKARYIPSEH